MTAFDTLRLRLVSAKIEAKHWGPRMEVDKPGIIKVVMPRDLALGLTPDRAPRVEAIIREFSAALNSALRGEP